MNAEAAQNVVGMVQAHGRAAVTYYADVTQGAPMEPKTGIFGILRVSDQQMLHIAALDLISRRFRERMAGSVTAVPANRDRIDEMVPQSVLDDAAESFVQAALGEGPMAEEEEEQQPGVLL